MVVGSPGLGLRFPGSRFSVCPSYRRRGRLPFPASVPASPAGRARGDGADGGHPAGLAAPRPELTARRPRQHRSSRISHPQQITNYMRVRVTAVVMVFYPPVLLRFN